MKIVRIYAKFDLERVRIYAQAEYGNLRAYLSLSYKFFLGRYYNNQAYINSRVRNVPVARYGRLISCSRNEVCATV